MSTTTGGEFEILDIGPTRSGSRRGIMLVVIAVIVAAVGGYFVGSSSKQGTGSPSSSTNITSPSSPSSASSPSSPSSPSSSSSAIAFGPTELVAGTAFCQTTNQGTVTTGAAGSYHDRNSSLVCTMTNNDPRVAGTGDGTWNRDGWGKYMGFLTGVEWGTVERHPA